MLNEDLKPDMLNSHLLGNCWEGSVEINIETWKERCDLRYIYMLKVLWYNKEIKKSNLQKV